MLRLSVRDSASTAVDEYIESIAVPNFIQCESTIHICICDLLLTLRLYIHSAVSIIIFFYYSRELVMFDRRASSCTDLLQFSTLKTRYVLLFSARKGQKIDAL